jgi:hypothetical protein
MSSRVVDARFPHTDYLVEQTNHKTYDRQVLSDPLDDDNPDYG